MFRHTPYHMLSEALAQSGCPICAVVDEEVLRYLDQLLHENVNDLEFRETLRQNIGFCPTHAWWLVDRLQGSALGATIMYRDVVNHARRRLEEIADRGGTFGTAKRSSLLGRFQSSGASRQELHAACPACTSRDRIERAFVSTLIAHARDERFLDRYAASAGVCLIHLDQVLAAVRTTKDVQGLLTRHAQVMDRLLAELDEFQRKADYRFTGESISGEADAWQRAIELIDGRNRTR